MDNFVKKISLAHKNVLAGTKSYNKAILSQGFTDLQCKPVVCRTKCTVWQRGLVIPGTRYFTDHHFTIQH